MNKRIFILIFIFASSFFLAGWSNPFGGVKKKIEEGNKSYKAKKYDEALGKYVEGFAYTSESPILHYNIGNALYRQKKYGKSIKAYRQALKIEDPLKQSKIHYNIGNAYYRVQRLKESIYHYTKALEMNPDDSDARKNLEFVQAKMEEKKRQENQKKKKRKQNITGSAYKKKEKASALRNTNKMTKYDAEMLLDSLENEEKDVILKQSIKNISTISIIPVFKDW